VETTESRLHGSATKSTKKRPPFPGVALAFGYRPHYLASMRGIAKGDLLIQSLNPPKANLRQCPLPSRASSIDLEDSQPFVKSDHATSDFGVRRSFSSLRGPVRSFSLFYTRHGGARQVLPEMGSGSVAHYPEMGSGAILQALTPGPGAGGGTS